ncbi:citrinin biosynthesis oxydoreductase CtnB [Colletotrichum gloeosporioides Cg-14]|uniref:Citrinin biosynthesis oxydoreductase CtnB n=1 Tax=Colletotrichum gloeosporioides (strain Cg-14) TaxID=1237896 RepID=T0LU02_COLGC|nr:citrinin biosynthesis oxydoreductase CtnB [Colletotrichum gloeosporioides Cg-14]
MIDSSLHLPRILCLHGGGTNSFVFKSQARSLIRQLGPHFRFVFTNAPFISDAGPNVLPLYKDCGPFRTWLPWAGAENIATDKEGVIAAIENSLHQAMEDDDGKGATGPWVGLLGFSQGAKLCASLLFEQQLRAHPIEPPHPNESKRCYKGWKFALLLHGIAPLVALSEEGEGEGMQNADQILGLFSEGFRFEEDKAKRLLTIPTIHVHGLLDPGLPLGRKLLSGYCSNKSASVLEWEGDHRVPVKSDFVQKITIAILGVIS